jgi:hypothetical protein
MIIVKLLGIIDLIASILFLLSSLYFFSGLVTLITILAFILLIKGVSFSLMHNFVSIGDIICSAVIFYSLYSPVNQIVVILTSLFLLQKGIFSMLG